MKQSIGMQVNQEYWDAYTGLQHTKHELIRYYLNGWFPILTSWAGRVAYIDTHAGRGRHASGQLGSPLVALQTLLGHRDCAKLLSKSEVSYIFIEKDEGNLAALREELSSLEVAQPFPEGLRVEIYAGDSQQVMGEALQYLRATGRGLAPAFVFVDPFGFKLSYPFLHEFMTHSAVELFVNVMWRYLDMAIAQARSQRGKADLLDLVFGGSAWRDEITSRESDGRAEQTISLIQRIVGAKWATPVRMLGANRAIEYILLHLTNHHRGRDLMKRAARHICAPSGGALVARKRDNPAQGVLLLPDPLGPRQWVLRTVGGGPLRWKSLHSLVRGENWLDTEINRAVRDLLRAC